MSYDPHKHDRHSIRLPEYDYSQPNEYFITICTKDRECIFGEVVNGKMILNERGKIAETIWKEIPKHFLNTELYEFVVMPNHIHGIINIIHDVGERYADNSNAGTAVGARHAVPLREQFGKPVPNSIPTIVRSFKSAVAQQINMIQKTFGTTMWQRNYYEHIIRNKKDLHNARQYIIDNLLNWMDDEENPYKLS